MTVSAHLYAAMSSLSQAGAPDPTPNAPESLQSDVTTVLGIAMWIVIALCVAGVFITGGRMAVAWRNGSLADASTGLVGVFAACILVGSASGIVNFLI